MDLQKDEGSKGNYVPFVPFILIRAFDTKHVDKSYEIQQLIRISSDELKQVQEWCKVRHPSAVLDGINTLKYLDMCCPLYKIQFNVCDGMDEIKSTQFLNFILDRQPIPLWKMLIDQKLKQETEESARLKRKQMIEDKRRKGEIGEIYECEYWQQLDMDSIFTGLLDRHDSRDKDLSEKRETPNERCVLIDDLIKHLRGMLSATFNYLDEQNRDVDVKITRIINEKQNGSEIEIKSREEKVKPEPFRSMQIKDTISFLGRLKTGDMVDHKSYRGQGLYYCHRNYLYTTTGEYGYFLPSCAFEMVLKYGLDYFTESECGAEFVLVPNDMRVTYLDSETSSSSMSPFVVEISNTKGNKLAIQLRDKVNSEDYLTVNDKRFEASMIEFY